MKNMLENLMQRNRYLLLLVILSVCFADDKPATYDQRQNGKFNIHINIKDVAIIDLEGNDFADAKPEADDYYYDDDDFTIKPISSWLTSSKPSTTTLKPTSVPEVSITTSPILNTTSLILSTTSPILNTTSPALSTSSQSTVLPITLTTSKVPLNLSTDSNISAQSLPTANEIPKPISLFATKKPNVIIIETAATEPPRIIKPNPFPLQNGGEIPVQIIVEPVLHPKQRIPLQANYRINQRASIPAARIGSNNHRTGWLGRRNSQSFGCQRGSVMDANGNCRHRRSSFLGKIINMIKSMTPSDE